MSSIDNRIVQMQFENSQFEKGIKQSLKSIEELENSLKFDEAKKSIAELQKVGDSFSLAGMADGIEKIGDKFSALGIIGKRVLEDITDSAYRMGKQFIASVSTDQITEGWKKYADKTQSVQTIVAATGKDIDFVNEQLNKLAWFTDETSYNFVDMTSNIGKFTSMGIDLDTSVTAMEGIATWAAVSGQNAASASRAMYNMAQAIGVGSVKLMDWKSIENANMATKEFKQTAISTAQALGKLNKNGKTAKGTLVTFENFSQTLSEGWFTKDVLLKTLEKYGEYADAVYKVASERGITAAEAMKIVGDETMKLGAKAFRAAQEAKTFGEAIGSVKDAVSTGWMNIFENIFGNYEEAKVIWTDLANFLWDVFAAPLSDTNELLSEWKQLGGRTKALEGIYDIFEALEGIISAVGDAISKVFPAATVDDLLRMSDAIAEFGANFKEAFSWTEHTVKTTRRAEAALEEILKSNNFEFEERSEQVRELQKELIKLGFLTDADYTGIYDKKTEEAIDKFQNGVEEAHETLENSFKMGDRGKDVEELQKKLIELGYEADVGAADGIYGPKTDAAFKKYQKSITKTEEKRKKLQRGDKGADVKELQEKLNASGKADKIQADGIYGPKTEEAIKKYQKAKGLTETGIFDEATIAALYPEDKTAAHNMVTDTETVTEYGEGLTKLQRITTGAASALHIFTSFFGFLGKVGGHVISLLSPLGDAFITIVAAVGDSITAFDQWLQKSGLFDKWFEDVKKFLEPFGKWIEDAAQGILRFFGLSGEMEESNSELMTFSKLYNNIKESIKKSGVIDKIKKSWENLKKTFEGLKKPLTDQWKTIKQTLGEKFTAFVSSIPEKIGAITSSIGNLVSKGLDLITPWIQKIPGAIEKIKGFWAALTQKGDPATGQAPGFLTKVKDGLKSVIDFLFGEGDIESGKKPGIFRKVARLITGDLEGFTEGLDDDQKQQVLDKIQSAKDFLQKFRESIVLLFTGKIDDNHKVSDSTIAAITNFRDNFVKVIEAIRLVFTGVPQPDTKLSKKTIKKIQDFRTKVGGVFTIIKESLVKLWNTILGIFRGEIKFDSIGAFFSSFWESIKDFIKQIVGTVSTKGTEAWENVKSFFEKLWSIVKTAGKWLLIGFAVFKVAKMIGSATGAFDKLKDVIESYKKNTQALSKTVLEFAGAIALIAGSIWLLGQLSPEQFKQGAEAVGGIVVAIVILLAASAKYLSKDKAEVVSKLGAAIWDFAKAIGVLALTVVVLSVIPWKNFFNGLAKVAILCGLMIHVIKKLNKAGATNVSMSGLWDLAVAIGILALVVGLMGRYKWKTIAKGFVGLYGIVFILRGLMKTMGKWGSQNVKLKGFIGLSIAIGILAGVVAVLGRMKTKTLIKGLGSLLIITFAVRSLVKAMGSVDNPNYGGLIAAVIAMGLVMAGLVIALKYVKDVDYKTILAFSAGVSAILVATGLFAKLSAGATFGGVTAGALGLLEVIGVIALVIAAFAGLNQIPGFREFMESGAEVIGSILGTLASAFVNKFSFAENFNSYASEMGSIESTEGLEEKTQTAIGIADSLKKFAASLPAKEWFNKIVDCIFGSEFQQFSKDMKEFGSAFNSYAKDIGSIETFPGLKAKTLAATTIAASIRDFAVTLPEKTAFETIRDRIFGSEFAQFSADMKQFGGDFNSYSKEIGVIKNLPTLKAKTTAATVVCESLRDFAVTLPEKTTFETIAERIFGSEFAQFSADMKQFGGDFNSYSKEIGVIKNLPTLKAKTTAAAVVCESLRDFAVTLPEKTTFETIAERIFGSEFAQFSADMKQFGGDFNSYSKEIGMIKNFPTLKAKTTAATVVCGSIRDFAVTLPEKTIFEKIADRIFGSEFKKFSEDIPAFASGFNNFSKEMQGITWTDTLETDTGNAIKIATDVAKFLAELNKLDIEKDKGAVQKWLTGDTAQGTVFSSIGTLADKMKESMPKFKGLGSNTFVDDVKAATVAATVVASFLNYIASDEFNVEKWVETNYSSSTTFDEVMAFIGSLADKIKEFSTKVGDADLTGISAAISSTTDFLRLIMDGTNGTVDFSENSILSFLSEDKVAEAMANVVTSISGQFDQAGIDLATAMSTGMTEAEFTGPDTVATNAITALNDYQDDFKTVGGNFAVGLGNGINDWSWWPVLAAATVANKMVTTIQTIFDSHSPSKVTTQFGQYFTEGLAIGTKARIGDAESSAEQVANSMLDTASGTLSTLSSLLAEDIDDTPVIAPVVDLTNARATAAQIGSLFGNQDIGVTSQYMAKEAQLSTNNGRPVTIQNGSINTSEAVDGVNERLTALTNAISTQGVGTTDDPRSLADRFSDLAEAVTNLKIVLDSGVLVGEIMPAIDSGLGTYAMRRDRGN